MKHRGIGGTCVLQCPGQYKNMRISHAWSVHLLACVCGLSVVSHLLAIAIHCLCCSNEQWLSDSALIEYGTIGIGECAFLCSLIGRYMKRLHFQVFNVCVYRTVIYCTAQCSVYSSLCCEILKTLLLAFNHSSPAEHPPALRIPRVTQKLAQGK